MQQCAGAGATYLNRTEDPKDQGLNHDEQCTANAEGKVHSNVLGDFRVRACSEVFVGPPLQPNVSTCKNEVSNLIQIE